MKKLVAVLTLAALAMLSVPALAGGTPARRANPQPGRLSGTTRNQMSIESAKGRRAMAAAEAAGAAATIGRGTSVRADFDDDGRQDLAIGVPDEDYAANGDGVVQVIYGTANGLASAGDQLFGEPDVGLFPVDGEGFGTTLAAGDFDGDGFTDLAVGSPQEDGSVVDDGLVTIVHGSASGLNTADVEYMYQDNLNTEDSREVGDLFGSALAAANFGNGAATDLAVGVSGESLNATDDGAVHVFYGSASGLDPEGDTFLSQDSGIVEGVAEDGDGFGFSLAAANFGQTSHADLAIGVPFDNVGGAEDAGAVNVLFGSSDGITVFNDQLWHQDRDGVVDVAEEADFFGISMTAANFGKSSQADLAVGAYFEGISGPAEFAGAVHVFYGGAGGLTSAGDQLWHQNVPGIAETAEFVDFFGWSVTSGNFGKSSHADLAIGVPLEGIGALGSAGVVHVLYGTSTGLKAAGDQLWHQNSSGIAGTAAAGDIFGWSLGSANYGKSSHADLAVGVPNDVVGGLSAGAVNVIYGSSTGLSATGDQLWSQNSTNIEGGAEAGDGFGSAVR
jgi:disulfide bond formation protein DsbB